MSHRVERFASTLKQTLAEIIAQQINNPRIGSVFISQVLVTPDLKTARVFCSSLHQLVNPSEDPAAEEKNLLLEELNNARGFIKRELGKRMYLKYIPELIFLKDEVASFGLDGR